jgi:hypothetical protein
VNPDPPPRTRLSTAHLALIAVCVLHALSPLLFRGLHAGLGWDETVYISQIDPHVPAGLFSAPRARGLTLLTAPASYLSGSIAVMRVWLALLSGIGLYLAFVPWLRIRNGAIVPVAALLWSTLWVSIYYGFEAMPNQYVAYGAVAAVGWLMLALGEGAKRRHSVYLAIALGFTALMRPSDSVCLLAALIASALLIRGVARRRRLVLSAAMAAGWAIGFAEWVIEAYARFGGPVARFHAASNENEGGLHWSLGAQMRTLAGPLLCRTGCHVSSPVYDRLWWFALVPLVVLGIIVARRRRESTALIVALAAGLAIAAEYIFAVDYSAPRFLEPTYLLLAIPVAEGVVWVAKRLAPAWRPIAVAAVAVVLVGQVVSQARIVNVSSHTAAVTSARDQSIAASLNAAGIRGRCSISGLDDATIAFLAGCTDTSRAPNFVPSDLADLDRSMAVISNHKADAGAYYAGWPEYEIHGAQVDNGWRVWILPSRDVSGSRLTGGAAQT